jgi:Xaa-Pro aminopeptidase
MAVAPVSTVPAPGPGPAPAPYAERRAELMRRIGPDGALVLASPPEHLRNGDTHFKFRQDSDILYLTGFEEPGAVVVIRPGHATMRFVLFVRPRDPAEETWTGRRAGVEGAVRDFHADAAFVAGELDAKLAEILAGAAEIHYPFGREPALDAAVARLLGRLRVAERRGTRAPVRLVDARVTLHEMRLIKSPQEVTIQRRAAEITAEAHIAAMLAARDAASEHEIEALVDYTFRKNGGTGPGYPTIVGGGANATILHYVENRAPLVRGQLLLIDAGCEIDGYTADVTRTSPIGAKFSTAQRRLYEAVLETQIAAIEAVKPGATLDAIHKQVVEQLTGHMVSLGLLTGEVPALIEAGAHKQFYMHRTSHWLGMDVHDVGFYSEGGAARPLVPGMVLTIEPGLYVAADAQVPPEFRGLGVRIEDDILVTSDGYDNLTAATPKSVADIESLTA